MAFPGDPSDASGRDLTDGEQKEARDARQHVHSNDQMYALPIDELTGSLKLLKGSSL